MKMPEPKAPTGFDLSGFFIRNYQFTLIIFAMLIAMGVTSWLSIPRQEDPTFPAPIYNVIAVFPGASPIDIEQLVVDPIETRMGELDDLKTLRSRIEDGVARVTVEFDTRVDADRKYDEVVREVNALRADLPPELHRLSVEQFSSKEVNIVQLALVSDDAPYRMLEDEAKRLKRRIETVPGVRTAETWAYPDREVVVSLDLGRLAQLSIAPMQVLSVIGSENASIPGGSAEAGGRAFNVKTSGSYASLEEIRATVLRSADGAMISVGDVADVEWGYADTRHIGRYNGQRAVWVTATQKDGYNIARVRDGIWAELDAFERALPAGITLERGFDQAVNVQARLARLQTDFMIAIGLVLITLLPLGLRAAGIVMVSIPLSLAMGVTLLNLFGFSLNQLSIVGFIIALGLLVDDSIVVTENITRFLREGRSRLEAAILATRQITGAVVGSTAVLVFAFLPLMFLPGLPGRFIRVLPLAVVLTVLASLFVSLTIIPWLASRVLSQPAAPRDGAAAAEEDAADTAPHGGNVFMRGLERLIRTIYTPFLLRALRRPAVTLGTAVALVLGSLALVPVVGFSLFPKAGTPQFLIDIETPNGSSLAETDRAARFAEQVLAGRPDAVRHVFTNVGRDNPFIYYNELPRGESPNVAQLFVLTDARRRLEPALLDSLRAQLAAYPGARIELKEFEQGPPIDAPIALRVTGENLDTLRLLAAEVEQVLRGTAGTQYVHNPVRVSRTDLRVAVDRQKAGMVGVATAEIDRAVRLGIAGLTAGRFRDASGDEYGIRVRLAHDDRPTVDALERVYVASFTGAQLPLRQVAALRFEASPPSIQHYGRERAATVTSHVRTGYNTDRVTKAALARLDELELPAGYRLIPAGEIESRQESFGGAGSAVVVALFMILAILVLEFRTFKSTLIVASVIPLGFVGGVAALLLTGYTLSFTAVIGFVALMGIEIKTSILLVDFANQLREKGMPLDEAIVRAGEIRFVPILLTTMTAVGGLLPLALAGSSLYSPLAWVIIGGLVSSAVLARIVTPVMYKLLAPAVEVQAA
jgi:multidrug efflux pump subunit AcrB